MTTETTQPVQPLPAEDDLGAVLRDYLNVTERLQRTHETLQAEVVRLRRELASKNQELERRRRLAALGELAAGVAHEVRNPLGAIQLYSGLLRTECVARGGLEAACELIEKIEAGIRAIDGVVQDTLALAPRRSSLAQHPLRTIVERARDVCLKTLQAERVTLATHYEDPTVRVLADKESLQRVLVNLIVNAAEASPPEERVTVQVGRECDHEVEMRVTDRGPGLPDEVRDQVFDPFFTTKSTGTGLGLTIAHRLVEAHGGRLLAHNRPEGGAEFVVVLPTADAADREDVGEEAARRHSAA
jgi:two-component system C4-dicarboxylate transport sensor histidine kinase DctB